MLMHQDELCEGEALAALWLVVETRDACSPPYIRKNQTPHLPFSDQPMPELHAAPSNVDITYKTSPKTEKIKRTKMHALGLDPSTERPWLPSPSLPCSTQGNTDGLLQMYNS